MNPILVALDVADAASARELAMSVRPHVGGFKVGLELIMAEGPVIVSEVARLGLPVFADVKLHDIPNTVFGAARQVGRHGARWITAHSSGGQDMIEAAVEGFAEGGGGGVLAVTVLTSMDREDLLAIGVGADVGDETLILANLAARSGAEGVVCSPLELGALIRSQPDLLKVTPGIRPPGTTSDDQKRTADAAGALAAGADLLVVGRAITSKPDPGLAAAELARSLGFIA